MVVRTEVAIREHPGIVLNELAASGQCVSNVDGSIVDIEDERKDPERSFKDIGDFVSVEDEDIVTAAETLCGEEGLEEEDNAEEALFIAEKPSRDNCPRIRLALKIIESPDSSPARKDEARRMLAYLLSR